jgi:hypothetical protein
MSAYPAADSSSLRRSSSRAVRNIAIGVVPRWNYEFALENFNRLALRRPADGHQAGLTTPQCFQVRQRGRLIDLYEAATRRMAEERFQRRLAAILSADVVALEAERRRRGNIPQPPWYRYPRGSCQAALHVKLRAFALCRRPIDRSSPRSVGQLRQGQHTVPLYARCASGNDTAFLQSAAIKPGRKERLAALLTDLAAIVGVKKVRQRVEMGHL